ncbi:SHOCT domain-containing protein [Bacillus salitolerans]|uniref:SHOCT domain-containing protein n=1 Tax=Bacillus salitolerans TaxID=1437434 RepID=A0ABW4LP34_9BACI
MFPQYRVKPSKSSSVLGMVIGIIFVCIGVFQFISVGIFGIIWTLVAATITIYHAVNVFSKEGVSSYQVDVGAHNNTKTTSEDIEADIRKLHRLMEDNIISEEEYTRKKEELLNKW